MAGPAAALGAGFALGGSFVDFRCCGVAVGRRRSTDRDRRNACSAPSVPTRLARRVSRASPVHLPGSSMPSRCSEGSRLPTALALFVRAGRRGWVLQIGCFTGLLAWLGPLPFGLAAPLTFTAVEFRFRRCSRGASPIRSRRVVSLLQSAELAGPYLLGFAIVWVNAGLVRSYVPGETEALGGRASVRGRRSAIGGQRRMRGDRCRCGEARRCCASASSRGTSAWSARVTGRSSGATSRTIAVFPREFGAARSICWSGRRRSRSARSTREVRMPPRGEHPFPQPPRPLVFGGLAIGEGPEGRRLYNSAFLHRRRRERSSVATTSASWCRSASTCRLATRFPWLAAHESGDRPFQPWRRGHGARRSPDGVRVRSAHLLRGRDPGPGPRGRPVGATLLLNLTNDAWYGASAEPYQHQALALWRAVEMRRDFIRSTNTGLTAAISATGEVVGGAADLRRGHAAEWTYAAPRRARRSTHAGATCSRGRCRPGALGMQRRAWRRERRNSANRALP